MAQDNPGAVGAVQAVGSTSKVAGTGTGEEGLPSQQSVNIATSLAAGFNQPDEKIPEIAQAVEGVVNAKSQSQAVDAFKKLAELLGIDLDKPSEKAGADKAGGAGGAEEAGGSGDDIESLIEKLIKALKAQGMSDAQIKALLGPILQALGKSPEEASAMLDKALGAQGSGDKSGASDAGSASPTSAQFNRG